MWKNLIIPVSRKIPIDPNGGVPVNIQDQITEPFISYFTRQLGTFSISSDIDISGTTVSELTYSFNATAGHGLSDESEIVLYDNVTTHTMHCYVVDVTDNTITVDRPIDFNFTSANTVGLIVSKSLKVDGSSTPVIFNVSSGIIPVDALCFCMNIICTSEPADDLFGNIAALSKGITFRIIDSYSKTLGNIKDNGTLKSFGADVMYTDKAGGSNWSVCIRLPFREMWGIAFRVKQGDALQVIIQDDLTSSSIVDISASIVGHFTHGEV